MIKNILTHIGGVENYGIISIFIFFAFFLGVLVWAFTRKKNYIQSMSTLPLDGGEREIKPSTETHSTSKPS
jgi:cytochrome c oxidase cbb3-type subunit IV